MPTLSPSMECMTSWYKLPKTVQKKVSLLFLKFEQSLNSKGLNFEKINTRGNSNMWSLRVDRSYRAILSCSKRRDVFVLLKVDHHDLAYEWANSHECKIHPEIGALQIFQPKFTDDELQTQDSHEHQKKSPFNALTNVQLRRIGVPDLMIPEIRSVLNDEDLDDIQDRLPIEAYESLFLFLAGDSFESIQRQLPRSQSKIDEEDFKTALEHPVSKSRFALIEDDIELEKMLNAPLEHWRVFLHPKQRELVERNWNGPIRVLGAAGTGKTVVAIHRAKWLAKQLINTKENSKILFVTFTRNLAIDLEDKLRSICSPEELKCIEVTNLDQWLSEFLNSQNVKYRIVWGNRNDTQEWHAALNKKPAEIKLSDAFYDEEWSHVIEPNNIQSKKGYLRILRAGRRKPLNAKARSLVWPVFEEYLALLAENNFKESGSAYVDAIKLIESGQLHLNYSSVIVDEAQDIGMLGFKLLRSLVNGGNNGENDLFIVGDAHQRIYDRRKVVLKHCGIDIVGRGKKLTFNYRTTEQTYRWAKNLLAKRSIDDLNDGADDNNNIRFLTRGRHPLIEHYSTLEEQCKDIVRYIEQLQTKNVQLNSVCIVCRTKKLRSEIRSILQRQRITTWVLSNQADDGIVEQVRLSTAHRIKGLEFDYIIVASCNRSEFPHISVMNKNFEDEYAKNFAETLERSLLYVAATRAKKQLVVTSYGNPSRFLDSNLNQVSLVKFLGTL